MQLERLKNVDYETFSNEILALRTEATDAMGDDDLRHLSRIIWLNRLCTFLGYATAWIIPNPVSAYLISQGIFGRWIVMHHVSHRGYDSIPGVPRRYTSAVFARGWRRWIDWFDWIHPAAWDYAHNKVHHYYVGESADPDLAEVHFGFLRDIRPAWLRWGVAMLFFCAWKPLYYAPNIQWRLARKDDPKAHKEEWPGLWAVAWQRGLDLRQKHVRQIWFTCYLPYIAVAFVLLPLLFLPLGKWAVLSVLINRLLAEVFTNLHALLVIAPSHAGEDLYRFEGHFSDKAQFCVHQVIASCNYRCARGYNDYFHAWLNYQIEHHLYPHLSMLAYTRVHPTVKAICAKHGVPYVQDSVFRRFGKFARITLSEGEGPCLRQVDAAEVPAREGG